MVLGSLDTVVYVRRCRVCEWDWERRATNTAYRRPVTVGLAMVFSSLGMVDYVMRWQVCIREREG